MKKMIFSLSMILSLGVSQANTQNLVEHNAPKSFSATEAEYLHPDAVIANHLTVKGMQIKGFSGDSLVKIQKAFEVLEKVVNSEEFKERVINFKNTKGQRAFASNNGLTNEEIFERFMDGRETLQPNTPGEMNYYLSLYNSRWSRVIGYTSASTNVININWKYFRTFKPNEVAGNLAHEWTHKIGFDHKSAAEHDSAPYAIGYIVEELAAKYLLTSPTQKVALR